jgi:hypothetical protein
VPLGVIEAERFPFGDGIGWFKTNLFWLVVWNMNFMTFHILGMSSSQLTNSIIFQRGRYTTNLLGVISIHLPVVFQVIHNHFSTNQTSKLFSSQLGFLTRGYNLDFFVPNIKSPQKIIQMGR